MLQWRWFLSEDVTLENLCRIWEERLSFGFELSRKFKEDIKLLDTVVDCLKTVDDLVRVIGEVPDIS